jgi:hypothetical protein
LYDQEINTGNDGYRNVWITSYLSELKQISGACTLLDVGAGLSPYKNQIVNLGYEYKSHDFNDYIPQTNFKVGGLHSPSWKYPKHDYNCDILEIPEGAIAEIILCTEVLEHIPDPVRAFEKLVKLTKTGGYLLISVPFSSLMHQAPYWFQAGLSPFWFEYWAEKFHVEVVELVVYGDYVDQMLGEIPRLFPFLSRVPGAIKLASWILRRYRRVLSREVLTAGGHGVLFVGRKTEVRNGSV